jgi:hypothetical protein
MKIVYYSRALGFPVAFASRGERIEELARTVRYCSRTVLEICEHWLEK